MIRCTSSTSNAPHSARARRACLCTRSFRQEPSRTRCRRVNHEFAALAVCAGSPSSRCAERASNSRRPHHRPHRRHMLSRPAGHALAHLPRSAYADDTLRADEPKSLDFDVCIYAAADPQVRDAHAHHSVRVDLCPGRHATRSASSPRSAYADAASHLDEPQSLTLAARTARRMARAGSGRARAAILACSDMHGARLAKDHARRASPIRRACVYRDVRLHVGRDVYGTGHDGGRLRRDARF